MTPDSFSDKKKMKLSRLKSKIREWKEEGYDVDDLQEKLNLFDKSTRTPSPRKRYLMIGIVLSVFICIVITAFIFSTGFMDYPKTKPSWGFNDSTTVAVIDTSMGTIKVELFKDKVLNTCENFIKLANDGCYNGLVFHRVIDNFMIQGGGFTADGTPKESLYGPIYLEINPEVRHVDGAIAMARTSDPSSATSQFYICDGAQSSLDDNYAVFGVTIEGIDVVRAIASVSTTTKNGMSDWPVDDVTINSIAIENQ